MDISSAIKFGIAGNMTGHLEQAGEASDFVGVAASVGAPKGLFPWHVPGAPGVLGVDPVCDRQLRLPEGEARVQLEPEVALLCDLLWADGQVVTVRPRAFAAYNDASIRKDAPKISFKKNWGRCSKGLGNWVSLDGLAPGGTLDRYHLASFVRRDGVLYSYGEDSPVRSYAYFHDVLLDWIVDRLNHQRDHGPLEHMAGWLAFAGRPSTAVIGIGATRYTAFGREQMLRDADEVIVVVYDGSSDVRAALETGVRVGAGASVLKQTVVMGD